MDRKNRDSYTTVYSSPSVTSAGTPLWQIIVSAVVGLLALLVLIIVLVKCDFFRNDAMQLSFFSSSRTKLKVCGRTGVGCEV